MRNKRSKVKIASFLLILLGVCVIAYPFLRMKWQEKEEKEIVKEWKDDMKRLNKREKKDSGKKITSKDVIAIIKIPSIDMEEPILKGVSDEKLNLGICTIEPTGTPGEEGNFALAGHNSRRKGRHFNRLHEVKKGDTVTIEQEGKEEVTYTIDRIKVIKDTQVEILKSKPGKAEITMITCYYAKDGTKKRLAVQGKCDIMGED